MKYRGPDYEDLGGRTPGAESADPADPLKRDAVPAGSSSTRSDGKQRSKLVARVGLGAAAVALTMGLAACTSDENGSDADGGTGQEISSEEGGSEGAGEHGGGEGTEGGDGQGLGEAAEGGNVTVMAKNETYDEVRSGARLILAYDAGANAFNGTVENTTSGPQTRVRVEVHLDNGVELGPTTPTDLAAGEILPISLPAGAAPFQTWTAHPEVGSGEGSEGSHSEAGGASEGGSGEGSESGSGEGAAAVAPATYLSSSGLSRGVFATQDLQADEAYAGKLNDVEFALTYDPSTGLFSGRVKNEAAEGLCDVSFRVIFDGNRANSQSVLIPSLDVAERANFTISADSAAFTTWTVETNTYTCNDVPVHGSGGEGSAGGSDGGSESGGEGGEGGSDGGSESGGEGGEGGSKGSGEHGGSEGGSEGGGEGAGHEGGSEGGGQGGGDGGEGATTPIDQPTVTTINGLDVNFAYDAATQAFRGTIENNGSEPRCGVRMEIHVGRGSQTIELGPTVDEDFAPGDSQRLVLAFDALPTDTYGLHPEVSLCP